MTPQRNTQTIHKSIDTQCHLSWYHDFTTKHSTTHALPDKDNGGKCHNNNTFSHRDTARNGIIPSTDLHQRGRPRWEPTPEHHISLKRAHRALSKYHIHFPHIARGLVSGSSAVELPLYILSTHSPTNILSLFKITFFSHTLQCWLGWGPFAGEVPHSFPNRYLLQSLIVRQLCAVSLMWPQTP